MTLIANSKPRIKKISGGLIPQYRLLQDYRYYFYFNSKQSYVDIPKGFEYDGATDGGLLFTRKNIDELGAPLFHDYAYTKLGDVAAQYIDNLSIAFSLNKAEVDRIFLEDIRRNVNVQDWRALIASIAVKTIGSIFWYRRKWFG